MAQKGALVRRLPAVETLGSVGVICTDKTGTLTENRMLVERLWTPTREYRISGHGYVPEGKLEPAWDDDGYAPRAARVAAACNDAALSAPIDGGDGIWSMSGDPTEAALLAFAAKLGVQQPDLGAWCPRVAELGFDAQRRRMTTLHLPVPAARADEPTQLMPEPGRTWIAVKGALESLAPLLAHDQHRSLGAAREAAARFASQGYRVLALAEGTIEAVPERLEAAEQELCLVGVVAMADPPREAARASIELCRSAGVRVVMITGDDSITASTIARRLGLLRGDAGELSGDELAALDDRSLAGQVADVAVYARTSPEQKLRIVDAWKDAGAIVAMTGDGVNDAPALRRADIGVAMGVTGTDVTKEAADMILSDDDFSTIVAAVEEGRRIYANIRHFVRYMLTTNSAEIWVMVLAPLLGLPLPLLAVQILWMNLVTDGAPALFLGVEPAHGRAMTRPPRRPDASIIGGGLWQHAVWVGLFMAALALLLQAIGLRMEWPWQTMVFTALAFMQLAHALAVRSERDSTLRLGWATNLPLLIAVIVTAIVQLALVYVPLLQPIFETESLPIGAMAVVALISPLPFVVVELEKWVRRRHESGASDSGQRLRVA
jgi:Ca2+-transporting ATPase